MRKIISLFQRNYDGDRLVRNEITPGAEWVAAGQGVATRKLDGTCCLVRDGKLFKRYEARVQFASAADPDGTGDRVGVRDGKSEGFRYVGKLPPGFEAATDPDPITLKQQGWVPVGDGSEDRWHREAWANLKELLTIDACQGAVSNGTYELIGPKVQGNPEQYQHHMLVEHGAVELPCCPCDFDGLRNYLTMHDMEGIVWHHDDGRMVKIKGKDFGIKRSARNG